MHLIQYRINASDTIIQVDEEWTLFALDNAAPELGASQVLGQPIWRYIHGAEMRHIYALLLSCVRRSKDALIVPFRCDGPGQRRIMQLEMTAQADDAVAFTSRSLAVEERTPIVTTAAAIGSGAPILTICSWCKRIRLADAELVEVEDAVVRLGLFIGEALPALSHGMCPACSDSVMQACVVT